MAKPPSIINGIPTAATVNALLQAFVDLPAGRTITHEEIETVVGLTRRGDRYQTIVSIWRKRLQKERNIDTEPSKGIGVVVLGEYERVEASVRDYLRGARKIGRSARRIGLVRTELLSADEQRKAEHARRHIEGTLTAARQASKEIASSLGSDQARLPRWKPEGQ